MKEAMGTSGVCRECGAGLEKGSAQGLCPACLERMNAAQTRVAGDVWHRDAKGRFVPPQPEALAGLFPQLEILGLLGAGGMGAVYKARQRGLDRLVALKILPPQISQDPAFAERFSREARALARLNHPNVVAVYDLGQTGDLYYFLMEFVDGLNLRQRLQSGRLPPDECYSVVLQVCEALQYAHDEGIAHRDIKPENILVDRKGRVKIADFGLSKLLGAGAQGAQLTQPSEVMGTLHYMAPEQFERPLSVDHRADLYSLGVVFYEMLTGELPLGRFSLPSQKAPVDARLDEIVLRSLDKDPDRRYQRATEVRMQVEALAGLTGRLSPEVSRRLGYEYRSKIAFWGLPLVNVSLGVDPITGRKRVAKGVIAIGEVACGVVAFGGMVSLGIIACGGIGIGVVSLSALALGVVAMGGAVFALLGGMGAFCLAPIAMGAWAVGLYSYGDHVWAVHAVGRHIQDPAAVAFFSPWGQGVNRWVGLAMPFVIPLFIALGMFPLLLSKISQTRAGRRPRPVHSEERP
jgi:eukaryotic-like serine/threonine-protein kinase